MKNGLVISDAGPVFSLAVIDKLEILNELFDEICIPKAVWEELTRDKTTDSYPKIVAFFQDKIREIKGQNTLTFIMDYGESESVILYKELNADFLLIDDRKARKIAENLDIQCIGTLGILSAAKDKGIIDELKPIFEAFLEKKRYYGLSLLNSLLKQHGESEIPNKS
jgi:predicted nucleic acid-binding protein